MASGSKKVIYAALIGNGLIAIAKYVGTFLTGSSAMLTEGIHSTVDTGNQLLLLLGIKRSKVPASDQHPFGHGKEVYFWCFAVAILIFGVGAGISIYEGIHSLMDPHPVTDVLINYIILGLAIIFEGFAWAYAFKAFQKSKNSSSYLESVRTEKDPVTFVVLFEDTAAMLGLIVAMAGIWLADTTGILIFDGIASITIGVILAVTATWLAYETKGLLIGESADPEIVSGIEKMGRSYEEIKAVNEVLTVHMGPNYILVNASVNFSDTISAEQLEKVIEELTREIENTYPLVKKVFIEAEE